MDPRANVLAGGFGGIGMEAKIAAVDDVEVTEVISGGLVGVVCGGLLCSTPPYMYFMLLFFSYTDYAS